MINTGIACGGNYQLFCEFKIQLVFHIINYNLIELKFIIFNSYLSAMRKTEKKDKEEAEGIVMKI